MTYLLFLLLILTLAVYGVVTHNIGWLLIAMGGMAVTAKLIPRRSQNRGEQLQKLLQRYIGEHWQVMLYIALILSGLSGFVVYYAPLNRLSLLLWLMALLVLLITIGIQTAKEFGRWFQKSWQVPLHSPHWNRLDWGLVLLLTIVAFTLRRYLLDDTFPPMREDEGFQGLLTLQALYGFQPNSDFAPLPPFGGGWFGHPTLFYFIQAGVMAIVGENLFGMRILAVIVGTLCAPTLYLLGKIGWGRIVGFSAGWLLAISHFHLQYSRMALQNIETVWLLIIFSCCIAKIAVRRTEESAARKNIPIFIIAGLAVGINQYFYTGARFAFILAVPLLLLLLLQHKIKFYHISIFVLVVLLVLLPQLVFYAQYPENFGIRTQGVNIFSAENIVRILGPEATLQHDWIQLLLKQAEEHWHFWFDRGDTSPFYWGGTPTFDAVTVILFWLGLSVGLVRLNYFPNLLALAWWGLGAFFAGIFTLNPTWGARLVVITPSVALIAGIFVQEFLNFFRPIWPQNTLKTCAVIFGGLGTILVFYLNFTTYFVYYAAERPGIDLITVAQPIAEHKDSITYLLGSSTDVNQGVIQFIARHTEKYNLPPLDQLENTFSLIPKGKELFFVVQPTRESELTVIQEHLPNGLRQTYRNERGEVTLITYAVTR